MSISKPEVDFPEGEPPETLLLIDDTAENVSAARQAGWRAVHWTAPRRLGDIIAEAGE